MWCLICGVMKIKIESVIPVFLTSRGDIHMRDILGGVPNGNRVVQKRDFRI